MEKTEEKKKPIFDPFGLKDLEKEDQPEGRVEEVIKDDDIDYKAKYEALKVFDTEDLDAIRPVLEEKGGVKTVVENLTTYEQKLKELEEKEAEREEWYKLNLVTQSATFQEEYQKPVDKALEYYNTSLGEVDDEGKPRNEEQYAKLRAAIWNKGEEIGAPQIKAILKKFAEQYRNKFGQDPDLPTIKEVLDARETLVNTAIKRENAIKNWEQETKERINREQASLGEKAAVERQAILTRREAEYNDYLKNLDLDAYKEFFEPDTIKSNLNSVMDEVKGIIKGERDDMDFPSYLDRAAKGILFDALLEKAKEYKSFVDEYKKGTGEVGTGVRKANTEENDKVFDGLSFFKLG